MSATTMSLIDRIGGTWSERAGAAWLRVRLEDVRPAARIMLEGGARLATILARPPAGAEGVRLSWHFAIGGAILALEIALSEGQAAPSIADIYPGADWAERETRDYYAVSFAGREATLPLVLGPGDDPGILLPKGDRS